jgi:hypothetical protein
MTEEDQLKRNIEGFDYVAEKAENRRTYGVLFPCPGLRF